MKKFALSALLIGVFMFTGCTKNYKTFEEYSDAMEEVRDKLGDYTVETVISTPEADINCRTYKKGEKWKTETSKNNGKTYSDGILYDGKEVYSFSTVNKMAMSIPFKQMLSKEGANEDNIEMVMKVINPTGILFYWDLDDLGNKGGDNNSISLGKITAKNDFKCRMISYKAGGEACISDKYGIAVYLKINTPEKGDIEYNVKTILNNSLNDSDLDLPEGVKKISMADLLQNMAKMFKQ